MSRHEGVSCDSCQKGNFRGKRYKCLICYDYDLCQNCYETGATTTRHTTDHPMQCILTRIDFDLFYGGEAVSPEQPQAFTCPYCGNMGFTEATLQEHVSSEHSNASTEVVCPICAALPGGDPNHVTDDFGAHLALEHRAPRDFDEPTSSSRHVRRMFHSSRAMGGSQHRRANINFGGSGSALLSSAAMPIPPPASSRDMDPIAELLSQLSGVRRATHSSTSSQLHQLQMQLQLERQQAQAQTSRFLERTVGHHGEKHGGGGAHGAAAAKDLTTVEDLLSEPVRDPQFLLSRLEGPPMSDTEKKELATYRVDRSLFVQELVLSMLNKDFDDKEEFDPHEDGLVAKLKEEGLVTNLIEELPPLTLTTRLGGDGGEEGASELLGDFEDSSSLSTASSSGLEEVAAAASAAAAVSATIANFREMMEMAGPEETAAEMAGPEETMAGVAGPEETTAEVAGPEETTTEMARPEETTAVTLSTASAAATAGASLGELLLGPAAGPSLDLKLEDLTLSDEEAS